MSQQLAFYFDADACSGCKTCQIACKDKNDLPLGVLWRRVYEVTGGDWQRKGAAWAHNLYAYNVSLACNHCKEPVCLKSCPAKAIVKRSDGIVLIDETKCMGCRYCEWVCPYGSPQFNTEKGVMTKCNLCVDYVEKGRNPSCVDSCPMRAMDFGNYDDLVEKYGDKDDIYPLPNRHHTDPSILLHPHRSATKVDLIKPEIVNLEEVRPEEG
ncbi:MAG: DMSO/selenate family reductase complex B subunit [Bacteroidales bacterium]